MQVLDDVQRSGLVNMSTGLTWASQDALMAIEDEFAKRFSVNRFSDFSTREVHYLALTSLPFYFGKGEPPFNIERVWPITHGIELAGLVRRPTMPTGNMSAKYMVVGDAPGVGDGELTDRFDRALVYGPSSHLLRKAMLHVGIHSKAWYTNLLKLSTPNNRPSTREEVRTHFKLLLREVELISPRVIITLGNHVRKELPFDNGYTVINLPHPSFFVRTGKTYIDYAKVIEEAFS